MALAYVYTCDGCGKVEQGILHPAGYLYRLPPHGWTWCFHGPHSGPHGCSTECWAKVERAADGRLYLPWTHEHENRDKPPRTVAPGQSDFNEAKPEPAQAQKAPS